MTLLVFLALLECLKVVQRERSLLQIQEDYKFRWSRIFLEEELVKLSVFLEQNLVQEALIGIVHLNLLKQKDPDHFLVFDQIDLSWLSLLEVLALYPKAQWR